MKKQLILGSGSPRRQDLLQQIQIPFTVRIPHVDESIIRSNNPKEKVEKLAKLKNEAIVAKHDGEVILTADTVVSYNNQILEKPVDENEAIMMLQLLSGSVHHVYTGVMIRSQSNKILFSECTEVHFWDLTDKEIDRYVKSGEPLDKAGSYGIQGLGAQFIRKIDGDYYNVVGLPVSRVYQMLQQISFIEK